MTELDFKINKYDQCVANLIIEGKQCIICWYVIDSKISHVNPKVVDWVIMKLEEKIAKMKVKRWKVHNLVGMEIEMKDNKTVGISIKDYVIESFDIFTSFEEKTSKEASTATKSNLFKIIEN